MYIMEVMGKLRSDRGQALLVVVIAMIVALTAGLSLASRTITNLKISKQNEDSQRAFQAASSGIERSIAQGQSSGTLNNASFSTTVSNASGNSMLLNNGSLVQQDRGIDLWLSSYPDFSSPTSGTISLYWGTVGQTDCTKTGKTAVPAIEVFLLSGASSANPTMTKVTYDPCATRRSNNAFGTPGAGVSMAGVTLPYGVTGGTALNFASGYVMKIIPIYNSAVIGVTFSLTTGTVPNQGKLITSTGSAGDTVRKVVYYESYPQIPTEAFAYTILSQ